MIRLNRLTFARLASDTYAAPCSTALLGDWHLHDYLEDDNFLARAYKAAQGNLVVVAVRGSANWKDGVVADVGAIGLGLNAMALKLNSAIDLASRMKYSSRDCWLVGHSLGGAYVQLLAAICELPGVTFNAPGALSLLNQMSPSAAVRIAGGLGGGALSVLSHGLVDFFNMAAASNTEAAFAAVQNLRGNLDPVSLVGTHIGMPLQTLHLKDQSPHPHSMDPIIRTLALSG